MNAAFRMLTSAWKADDSYRSENINKKWAPIIMTLMLLAFETIGGLRLSVENLSKCPKLSHFEMFCFCFYQSVTHLTLIFICSPHSSLRVSIWCTSKCHVRMRTVRIFVSIIHVKVCDWSTNKKNGGQLSRQQSEFKLKQWNTHSTLWTPNWPVPTENRLEQKQNLTNFATHGAQAATAWSRHTLKLYAFIW